MSQIVSMDHVQIASVVFAIHDRENHLPGLQQKQINKLDPDG